MPGTPLPIGEFDELGLLIRSHHPLIWIHAREVARIDVLLEHLCGQFALPLFGWTPGSGLSRFGQSGSVYGTESLLAALSHVRSSGITAIYHFNLSGERLDDPRIIALLEELRGKLSRNRGAVVFSFLNELPDDLVHAVASVKLEPPTTDEYYQYLRAILEDVRSRQQVRVELNTEELRQLIGLFKGLTLLEVRRLVTASMVEQGALDARAFERVAEAKGKSVAASSVLEYFPVDSGFEDLAGMVTLRAWLDRRSALFRNPEKAQAFGLSPPRGVLLLGVQGCGKSQTAKAVAACWKLPMLRLDAGRLYDKFVGATEANLNKALEVAEQLSPAVLWIDEIEKALASGGSEDGGTSQRVLGTFLTWLQERKGAVFVVATANNISKLPPELLRKGRFDEIFFVDLPSAEVRAAILRVHLAKRGQDPKLFELGQLADGCDGYSGSELEQAVVSALFRAFHDDTQLTTQLLAEEIAATVPLSVTMREQVQQLRDWAHERTTPAN